MRVVTGPQRSVRPTIYFLTPDYQRPSGGIRVIYRHVDMLNSAGMDAFVLHQRRGFRCTWFENRSRIAYVGDTMVLRGDILVIPEVCVDILDRLPPGTEYVIFNQNVHLTWDAKTRFTAKHYAPGSGLKGVIAVSKHNQEALGYAFEHVDVRRVHVGIDSGMFHPAEGPRTNRIAYMPRRMPGDAFKVLELLRGRGLLDGWDVVPLDRIPQSEVAMQLQTTKMFLAVSHQEGLGLPPAEAMACGNYVVGYHGFGGREFFRPDFSAPIEAGDLLGLAQAIEHAITMEHAHPGWCQARGAKASRFISSEYSLEREQEEVTQIYADFLEAT
ncbi:MULTISPECIES: glycosyltransferase [unclassified Sinorhizobium]|uniref:glycosyltransferase n=1 Tax=unclassified Sinorhizobium TaxID=2613772 RepID=UPI0024C3635C|nr:MULTISPECIES: glycosyltransferase [unclassified Sinorhizobium]MDK1374004.1 glycosyltransferase [Sinorhizobium sp. 6-70]MDK1477417.1 glycosyltransferase [Sinorhizobium sp. 6-117]